MRWVPHPLLLICCEGWLRNSLAGHLVGALHLGYMWLQAEAPLRIFLSIASVGHNLLSGVPSFHTSSRLPSSLPWTPLWYGSSELLVIPSNPLRSHLLLRTHLHLHHGHTHVWNHLGTQILCQQALLLGTLVSMGFWV